MNLREIFSEADVCRLVKVAEVVWREANTAFCTIEQVEYMIERYQSFEAVMSQLMQGYRYFVVEENGEIIAYFGVQPQDDRLFLTGTFCFARTNLSPTLIPSPSMESISFSSLTG